MTKLYDLAIAGEANLDLILYGLPLDLPPERELLATGMEATLGGSSAIVAHNAAMLGLSVQFSTVLGDDPFGRMAMDCLHEAKVDVIRAAAGASRSTGVSVLLPHEGPRRTLTYAGCTADLRVEHLDMDRLRQARHFHLSSLFLQTGLHPGLMNLFRELKAAGLSISLDTNDDPTGRWVYPPLDELLPYVDILLPNEDELCRMMGKGNLDEAISFLRSKVPMLVVKRGGLGCRVVHGSEMFDLPAISVTPQDTVGAGDSFDAGYLLAYLRGFAPRECAKAANIAGALSTLRAGGTEAFRDTELRETFLLQHKFLLG